jgi:hypothetical protein
MPHALRSLLRTSLWFSVGFLGCSFFVTVSLAEPVAIVEETENYSGQIQEMDLLENGQIISLGNKGRVKISYLETCVVEDITGGEITVGQEQSKVTGGDIKRKKIGSCSTGGVLLSEAQSNSSGVIAFRGSKNKNLRNSIIIFSRVPKIYASKEGHLSINEINNKKIIFSEKIKKGMNIFSKDSIDLLPGSKYIFEVSEWTSSPVFVSVDIFAGYGPTELLKSTVYLNHEK